MNLRRRRHNRKPPAEWLKLVRDYMYLLLGTSVVAVAFNVFVFPNKIASGGVSGISTIVGHLGHIEPGMIQWGVNIPLFILGLLLLGRRFGMKTLVGTLFLPLMVVVTAHLDPVTDDPFLAALFGGVGIGFGLGLVFRGKGSTGGTALLAAIMHKYTGLTLGISLLLIDGLIVLSSAIAFNIELALYAMISVYITGKTIDIVQVGLGHAKMALIISNEEELIREAILKDLDRGVTKLKAQGGYTDDKRHVLMCVVNQNEVTKLKELVNYIDNEAFIVVTYANEVLGEGFKREEKM